MQKFLDGDEPVLAILRQQLERATVIRREFTGVGFWTFFAVDPSAPRIPGGKSFNLSDVLADIEGLRHGTGFVLFVVDGALNQLEAFTYAEPWPEPAFKLGYHVGYRMEQERDRAALRKELKKLTPATNAWVCR
jgi:hypothetical protein